MELQCKSAPPALVKKDTLLSSSLISELTTSNDGVQTKTSGNLIKRNSSTDNKYHLTIPSERLAELKKMVEDAIRDHKTFTIRGKIN